MISSADVCLPIAANSEEEERTTISSRRTRRREISDLAEDQMVDILLRLPLKCLMRSKCVSRGWFNLITSPHLVSEFNAKNKANEVTIYWKVRLPYNPSDTNNIITIGIGFHDIPFQFSVGEAFNEPRIVGCSDGFVCLSFSRKQDKFAIFNPATRLIRLIPPLVAESTRYGFFSSGFCYDPVANAQKISRLEICCEPNDLQDTLQVKLHVFTLNSASWTEMRTLLIPFQTGSGGLHDSGLTCVGKYLFWTSHLSQQDSRQHAKYILCYDMLEELFTRIELPHPDWHRSPRRMRISSYKRTIAVFLCRPSPPLDIWVLNDCGGPNQSWSLQQIRTPSPNKFDPITYFIKDGVDLLLVKSSSGHLLWNPQTGETVANLGITIRNGGYATYYQSLTPVS